MHKILVDTCVWLDMAKDHEQQSLLTVIEELVERGDITLIVPRLVIVEFERNKERVIRESSKSLQSVFRRVKDAVEVFGDPKHRRVLINQLNDVNFKIPSLGENASASISRIQKLLNMGIIIEANDNIKLKAAQRAIDKRAPFHHEKNSINDAIIMETYAFCISDQKINDGRFAFVTHNKKDFSSPDKNQKLPHPDFKACFSKIKSQYYISLAELIRKIDSDLITGVMLENEWSDEQRTMSEIVSVEAELTDKLWYNRHQIWKERIEEGKIKLIDRKDYSGKYSQDTMVKDIWQGALKAAKTVEKKYGIENLGPWSDFEWGMLSGKISALRWVMGIEWDNLDT